MEQTLSASVVGGGMGGKLSLDALQASERFQLRAAADVSPTARKALAARYPGIALFGNHQEMFARCPTDVVCVSTWPPSHRAIVLDALHTPGLCGLLVEKPLADSAKNGQALLQAITASALPVVVPHGLLKTRHGEDILKRVHAGEIGTLELVEIQCHRWDIINAGIHWLDFFLNLVPDDPAAWVMAIAEASTQTHRDGMQVETTAITYVQTQAGVRCVMHTGDDVKIRQPGKSFSFRLVGTGGQILFWAWESAYQLQNKTYPTGRLFVVPPYPQSAHQRYLEDLAEQIAAGQVDYALPQRSLAALELCEGAYRSSAQHSKVLLPLTMSPVATTPEWYPGQPYSGHGGRDGRKL